MRSLRNAIVIGFAILLGIGQARGEEFDSILRWRNIGPYRGGRTRAIAGVPSQPNVFYMAPVNGGVFKSIDYGRTWTPIFDDQPTASVGALAVAPILALPLALVVCADAIEGYFEVFASGRYGSISPTPAWLVQSVGNVFLLALLVAIVVGS